MALKGIPGMKKHRTFFEEKMDREFKKKLAFLIIYIVGLEVIFIVFGVIKYFGG